MGYRLSKIYTRKGDNGSTRLGEGTRVKKDNPRVECYGNVDELNSLVGLFRSLNVPEGIDRILSEIQHDLFDLGGELCIPGHQMIREERIQFIENEIDSLNKDLAPLKEFVLPGGTQAAAIGHVARTVCRRAERSLVTLSQSEDVTDLALSYLNRLSDLLFVMARSVNKEAGQPDVLWRRESSD
jgi:cob(I)alamin adenosyltransferase